MSNNSNSNSIRFRLITAEGIDLAVPEDQITTVIDWTSPTTLPFGPEAVLGVVCVQGRMFTVLKLAKLFRPGNDTATSARLIVALRGDEQLAVAVDQAELVVELPQTSIFPLEQEATNLTRDVFTYEGKNWRVLNVDELFNSLVQGRERRRRRT